MAKIAEMTQLSPTMSEGKIVRWLKKSGDSVSPGEIIAEVETDKAVMEMEAFETGVILEILAQEGSLLPVGAPVAIIGKSGEDISALVETARKSIPSKKESAPSVGTVAAPSVSEKKAEARPQESISPSPQEIESEVSISASRKESKRHQGGLIKASPLAKNLALQNGIDLGEVVGSGPDGRILKRDILAFQETGGGKKGSSFVKPQDRKIELTGMRKTIATRLAHSTSTIPHFYLTLEIDAYPIDNLRNSINKDLKLEGQNKISVNDLILKACSLCLREVPEVNSSWREDHILQHGRVDIGVAVSIEGGLITPYVRDADRKSVVEISHEIKELASRARERKLKPGEYTDGTFTVSNLGMFGISSFTAVINEPEAAILAVGSLVEKAVIKDDNLVAGKTLTVTLSCDHRVVDGATGARFLSAFREFTEHPLRLLTG
ncbi:pyruvate dehydrogenase complex dihydrolipoamide acetyltransferase [Leptospira sp. WS92.C1]